SRRRHTRSKRDWSSDVCSSDLSSEVEDMCYDRKRNKQACKRCVVFNACWYYWQNIKCGLPDSVAKFNRGSRFLYVSTNISVIRYDPHSISLWLSLCDIKNGC